jgi:hypothetical protein
MEPAYKEKLTDQVVEVLKDTNPDDYHEILHRAALRRRYRRMHVGWQNVLDQVLHAAYAAAVFFPVLFWPSYWTTGLGGFLLGGIREVEQY